MDKDIRNINEKLRHLHPDAQYLICSDCKRKSYHAQINSSCNMIQPDETICKGIFKKEI